MKPGADVLLSEKRKNGSFCGTLKRFSRNMI
jgi:hypothetical protein